MKINNNIWFYSIQFFGWGLLTLLNILFKLAKAPELSKNFVLVEGFIFFSSAVIVSSLLRYYINKNNLFSSIKNSAIYTLIIAFIIGVCLLAALGILLSTFCYSFFHADETPITITLILVTLINTFIYLFLWLICYRIIKMTQKFRAHKEENLKLETTLKESELNTLKGQINPHFMFNSLNNIRGLMLEDVEKSRDMLLRLSDMLRYSLTQNKVDFIALKDEMEMVNNYIELSKIQLEDRLEYCQTIEDNLLDKYMPPMMVQMLIENAIKHGIANLKQGGKIHLNIYSIDKQIVIKVTNSGTLANSKNATKIGIENIKKRLFLLYKNDADFSLIEKNKKVIATIKLPI